MGKDKIINLFEQAIQKNELFNFASGQNGYFISDREYGGHLVLGSWINYILPFYLNNDETYVNIYIQKMLKEILESNSLDINAKNELLLYHLHVYYYLDSEHRLVADPLIELNPDLERLFNSYVKYLSINSVEQRNIFLNSIKLIKSRGGLNNCRSGL